MKRLLILILICISTKLIQGQPVINFNKFPVTDNDTVPMKTADLLKALDWESIKKFSDTTKGYHTRIYDYSLITEYKHLKQGGIDCFSIGSYKGLVLYFSSDVSESLKDCEINYFDKSVWLMIANDCLPNLPDSMKLKTDEPQSMLLSYYRLLGVDTRDEYGWRCEYSSTPMEPTKRTAIMRLLYNSRYDLIRRLIRYPNPQTQVYAADALIYMDYMSKQQIEKQILLIEEYKKELDSLNNTDNLNMNDVKMIEASIKREEDFIKYIEKELITEDDWRTIYELRDSKQIVKTCGLSGSYKIYESNTADLLSDKAISEIPGNYKKLERNTISTSKEKFR